MVIERIKLFWVKCRIIRILILSALFLVVVYYLIRIGADYYDKTTETTKGIIGTLLGAITGGCFTLVGSLSINKRTQIASNEIRKKNTIYKPLYDELSEIHNDILLNNPHPSYIVFTKGVQTERKHPQYTVWGRIKNDTRYLEVQPKLKRLMNDLYASIEDYQKSRQIAVHSLTRLFNEEQSKYTSTPKTKVINSGETLLNDIMDKGSASDCFLLREYSNEDRDELWGRLKERVFDNDDYQQLLQKEELWKKREEETIKLIGLHIQYITAKYEG